MVYSIKQQQHKYTYKDYLQWPQEEKWELIDGTAYNMTPAPSVDHQRVLGELFFQFRSYLTGKPCEAFIPPFDVRLPEGDEKDEDIQTVVQPDLTIICDKSKIDEKGCKGSPDLVIEVISPSTVKKDMGEKLSLYERVGVKEYWVVYPRDKTVMVFTHKGTVGYGRAELYTEEDVVEVGIFEDLTIDLKDVFK